MATTATSPSSPGNGHGGSGSRNGNSGGENGSSGGSASSVRRLPYGGVWAVPAVGIAIFALADRNAALRRFAVVAIGTSAYFGLKWLLGAFTKQSVFYLLSKSGTKSFGERSFVSHLVGVVLSSSKDRVQLYPLQSLAVAKTYRAADIFPKLQNASERFGTDIQPHLARQTSLRIGTGIVQIACCFLLNLVHSALTLMITKFTLSPSVILEHAQNNVMQQLLRHPPKAFTPAELEPFLSQQLAAVNQGWLGGIALDAAAAYQRLTDEPNLCRPPGEPTDVLLQFCTILACIRDGTLDRGTAFDVMDRTLSPSRAVGRTLVATFSDLVKEAHAQATWHLPKETLDRILRSHIARLVVELPKSSAAGAGPLSLVLAPVLLSGATLLAVLEGRSPGSITVSELVAQYLRDRWHRPASLGATAPGADAGVHVTDEGDDRYFASAGFGGVDLVLGPVGARVEGPSASIEALSGPNVLGAYANPKLARVEVDLGISKIEADLNLRTGVHAGQEGVGVSVLGLGFEVGATSGLKLATPLGSISLFGL